MLNQFVDYCRTYRSFQTIRIDRLVWSRSYPRLRDVGLSALLEPIDEFTESPTYQFVTTAFWATSSAQFFKKSAEAPRSTGAAEATQYVGKAPSTALLLTPTLLARCTGSGSFEFFQQLGQFLPVLVTRNGK